MSRGFLWSISCPWLCGCKPLGTYQRLSVSGQRRSVERTPSHPEENGSAQKKQIFSKEATFLVSDILSDREARSATFGLENPLSTRFWTAVKTGTSKDMRDNWCIGYSRKVTVGVWTGNFSGEPMWNVSGVTGAAPIWMEMMDFLHRDVSSIKREALSGLVRKKIEFSQGVAASREEWFIRGTEPRLRIREQANSTQELFTPLPGQ